MVRGNYQRTSILISTGARPVANETISKHTQSVLVSLATAAIGWLAFSVQENNVKVAVLIDKVDKLENRAYASSYDVPPLSPLRTPIQPYPALPVNMPEPVRRR